MKRPLTLLICSMLASALSANDDVTLAQKITNIIDAKAIKRKAPKYPISEARNGHDGWVRLSYIVEPDGTTSNIIVEQSSGRKTFEQEAIKAIKYWRFQPALENGKAIQQCENNVQMSFKMVRSKDGVSRRFLSVYNKLNSALENGDNKKVTALVDKVKSHKIKTLQESYYKNIILARFAHSQNNPQAQLAYLNEAYAHSGAYDYLKQKRRQFNDFEGILPLEKEINKGKKKRKALTTAKANEAKHLEQVLYPLLHEKLILELDAGKISDAYASIESLLLLESAQANKASYLKQKQILDDIVANQESIVTEANLGERDFWQQKLLRNTFQLADINGKLNKIDVRCRNKRHVYTVTEQSIWSIPENWQGCSVYVYGEDNTQFKLVETLGQKQANKQQPENKSVKS